MIIETTLRNDKTKRTFEGYTKRLLRNLGVTEEELKRPFDLQVDVIDMFNDALMDRGDFQDSAYKHYLEVTTVTKWKDKAGNAVRLPLRPFVDARLHIQEAMLYTRFIDDDGQTEIEVDEQGELIVKYLTKDDEWVYPYRDDTGKLCYPNESREGLEDY